MKSQTLKLGSVVRDRFGHVGVVCSKESNPKPDWIRQQLNSEEIEKVGQTDWWGVLVYGGGYLLAAGPLLTYLREATYDDFLAASDTARAAGRESLAKIFPEYVNRLLAERRSKSSD